MARQSRKEQEKGGRDAMLPQAARTLSFSLPHLGGLCCRCHRSPERRGGNGRQGVAWGGKRCGVERRQWRRQERRDVHTDASAEVERGEHLDRQIGIDLADDLNAVSYREVGFLLGVSHLSPLVVCFGLFLEEVCVYCECFTPTDQSLIHPTSMGEERCEKDVANFSLSWKRGRG